MMSSRGPGVRGGERRGRAAPARAWEQHAALAKLEKDR